MSIVKMLARKIRSALGTQQIIDLLRKYPEEMSAALAEIEKNAAPPPPPPPPPLPPPPTEREEAATIIELLRKYPEEVYAALTEIEGQVHPAPPPEPTEREGARLIELNGAPLWLPTDLLTYIQHTCVSAPGATVPQFLIETAHWSWIRDRLRVGQTALDIGANLGLFSLMMAAQVKYGQVGWIHAFEPSPKAHSDLRRLLAANGVANVVVNHSAVSDQVGKASFFDITTSNASRESSHLTGVLRGAKVDRSAHQLVEVQTVTLDSYVAFHHNMDVDLIKIDVEGAEFLVLEGGRELLRQSKPMMVIEIHPDEMGAFDHARLRKFLDEYDYTYRHHDKTYYCE